MNPISVPRDARHDPGTGAAESPDDGPGAAVSTGIGCQLGCQLGCHDRGPERHDDVRERLWEV